MVKLLNNKKINHNESVLYIFTIPAVILYTCFFIIPVVTGVYYSMTDWNGMNRTYNFIGLKNYANIFADISFKNAINFNIKYTIMLILAINIISLLLAILLNSKIKCRTLFRSIYFFPAVLSLITVGLIWNEIYYQVLPVIGNKLGIAFLSKNILSDGKTAIFGILITNVWQGVAVPTVLYIAGLQSIPSDLYEAATLDGATPFQQFIYITFRFLVPIININILLTLKSGLMIFDYIVALTDGGPGGATESIGILMYNHAFGDMKFSQSIAESIFIFLIIATVSIIQFKFQNKMEVSE